MRTLPGPDLGNGSVWKLTDLGTSAGITIPLPRKPETGVHAFEMGTQLLRRTQRPQLLQGLLRDVSRCLVRCRVVTQIWRGRVESREDR